MDRAAKLDRLMHWLAVDCKCDLVCIDDVGGRIVLEGWSDDHRAFMVEWGGEFDRLTLETIGDRVQRAYRAARAFEVPCWIE